jgi:hypothetical protein
VKQKLGVPKSTYRHNAQIGEYYTILTSRKKYDFDPLLTSSMKQALQKLQATAGKLKSLRVQRAIKLHDQIKIWQETTVLQS